MNFDYLIDYPDFEALYQNCKNAENFCLTQPTLSVTCSGIANEMVVRFLYDTLVEESKDMTIYEMLMNWQFKNAISYDEALLDDFHHIRKIRNEVLHKGKICSIGEAVVALSHLTHSVNYLFNKLGLLEGTVSFIDPRDGKPFAKPVPDFRKIHVDKEENVSIPNEIVAKYAKKLRYTIFSSEANRDESENKRKFFYASLAEAKWPIVNHKNCVLASCATLDFKLESKEICDVILYGRNSKPLAIIEYLKKEESVIEGRDNAIKKAKEISLKTGYMPVVYYTNGYMIYCIDGLGFPPRRVFNFHTVDELEVLVQRQSTRLDISNPTIDQSIAGRPYQIEAIKAVCKAFSNHRRRSLIVLATGTGKTRISIALSKILLKNNWVKNILFLADRTSLVSQANKNFTKLLPSISTSVFTGESLEKDAKARIIFSTYQTMMNLVEGEHKAFGIGRFDLIIIDEAHRSLFRKYKSLFDYFDAMMIGLTATPRDEQSKSTYEVFQMPENAPDYSYELEEAVKDGYLNSFALLDRTTQLLKRNKKYSELSQSEKDKLDEDFGEDNEALNTFKEKDKLVLSKKNINIPTINVMLNDLMKNGLHIENGDKIGKTIIFAKSHLEAQIIVNQFRKLYPDLGYDFCQLIDCQTENSQNLLDKFEQRNLLPQIAVSVDMLDTGIDVPDILNLVFFKQIRSKIKFLQMIGRGTRLSSDVFGPNEDKKGFLIFDYFDNFHYFETKGNAKFNVSCTNPASMNLNQTRLSILEMLQAKSASLCDFDKGIMKDIKDYFVNETQNLINDDVSVQSSMSFVNKYRTDGAFDHLTEKDISEINERILPLFPPLKGDIKTKSFDLFMYRLEENCLDSERRGVKTKILSEMDEDRIHKISKELLKLKNIPQIQAKSSLLKQFDEEKNFFDKKSLEKQKCIAENLEI